MGKLELAMNVLIEMFEKYAARDGDKLYLSGWELRSMFHAELGKLLQESRDPEKVQEILTGMDENLDGRLDFEEFVSMVTKFTMCSNAYFDKISGVPSCGVR